MKVNGVRASLLWYQATDDFWDGGDAEVLQPEARTSMLLLLGELLSMK